MKNSNRSNAGPAALGIVAAVVSGPVLPEVPSGANTSPSRPSLVMRKNSDCKDGTYTATGWYGSLPSSITVSLTLQKRVVTSVKVEPRATDPASLDLQRRFAAAVPAVVVGKRIDEVRVGRLAGSSGTPQGFNDAIRRIKQQACKESIP